MKTFSLILTSGLLLASLLGTAIQTSAQTIVITSTNSLQAPVQQPNLGSNVIVINGGSSNNQILNNTNVVNVNPNNFSNQVESNGFNPGKIFDNDEIYGLSTKFDSVDKIRAYLRSTGSFLADYKVDISLEDDDDLWVLQTTKDNIGKYAGTQMDFSEFVWRMARTNLGNSCSLRNRNICLDQSQKPINPAVILALIQRESGLIKGRNARLDPNSNTAKFLVERSVGYMCIEDDNKANSCWDENPDWKYFKGMFRQVYYGMRLMLINSQRCDNGNYGNTFRTGNVVEIDGQSLKLENGFSCSIYIYTPHILAQRNIYKVYKEIVA